MNRRAFLAAVGASLISLNLSLGFTKSLGASMLDALPAPRKWMTIRTGLPSLTKRRLNVGVPIDGSIAETLAEVDPILKDVPWIEDHS